MISAPRSLALLAAVAACLASTPALAQSGRLLGSPTGEPSEAPAEPTPPEPAAPETPAPETPVPAPDYPDAPATPAPTPPGEAPAEPTTPPGEAPTPEPAEPGTPALRQAPGSNTGEPIAPEPAETEEPGMRLVVVDAATFGIDPVVGRVASARMRETGAELGYHVLTQEETVAAAQRLRMPYPPTPADLWRVSWVAQVQRGAFARIWAHGGQYVIEVTVASLDGTGPFFARGTAGADDLREVVDRLLRTALPAPSAWNPGGVAPAPSAQPPVAQTPTDELDGDRPPRAEAEPEPELRRWQLTLQTEGAIGAAQEVFYNHLVGLRFDFRITRDILIGVYAAYANLNARDGRADNMLFMAQFENRIRISPGLDLTIPLRAAVGYLPFNGPVIRLSAGLNYAVSDNFEIGADLLAPMFWILPDRTAVTLNIALEGTYRF